MVDCHTLENIQIGCRNDYPKATRGISKRCSGKSNSPSGDCGRIKNADNQKEVPAELKLTLDVEWTAEALGNVIKNCIEHSPEGGSIEIKAIERPLLTQVIIEDNGAGFQEKDIPHLFDRFYQGNGSTIGNAGLGLALAKTIINNQGGIIRAKNQELGGAEFEICFYRGTA